MSKNKDAKRKAKLKARKATTGTVVNRKNTLGLDANGNKKMNATVTGSLMTDLFEEQITQRIGSKNIEELCTTMKSNMDKFLVGTREKDSMQDYCFLTENVYVSKVLLELINKYIESDDLADQIKINEIKTNMKKSLQDMEGLIIRIWPQAVRRQKSFVFVSELGKSAKPIVDEYIKCFKEMLGICDVGIFQKACRVTMARLGNENYQEENIKYYRIREGYQLYREQKAYYLDNYVEEIANDKAA
jgi:hypothetical protein